MSLEEIENGEYHYLDQDDLERLIDRLEDALTTVKRKLRDVKRYE